MSNYNRRVSKNTKKIPFCSAVCFFFFFLFSSLVTAVCFYMHSRFICSFRRSFFLFSSDAFFIPFANSVSHGFFSARFRPSCLCEIYISRMRGNECRLPRNIGACLPALFLFSLCTLSMLLKLLLCCFKCSFILLQTRSIRTQRFHAVNKNQVNSYNNNKNQLLATFPTQKP